MCGGDLGCAVCIYVSLSSARISTGGHKAAVQSILLAVRDLSALFLDQQTQVAGPVSCCECRNGSQGQTQLPGGLLGLYLGICPLFVLVGTDWAGPCSAGSACPRVGLGSQDLGQMGLTSHEALGGGLGLGELPGCV